MLNLFYLATQLLKLSIWLVILVAIFVPLEHLFAVHSHKVLRKGIGADLFYYFLNSILPAALLSIPTAILGWTFSHIVPYGFYVFIASLPFIAKVALALVAGEVGYYWGHRWSHQIPFLWRFHSVHHSAEEVDFLVNTRAHPLDMVFGRTCAIFPLIALGLAGPTASGSMMAMIITLIGTVWGFFIHANLKWSFGPLEWLISTPKFHHWHHTKTGLIDHNYSSTLPWLDRIFGTHNLPKEWPESYGIEAHMPASIIDQLTYPLVAKDAAVVEGPAQISGESDAVG